MKIRATKFFRRLKAHVLGYFWLPCPICREMFAGYECSGSLMTDWSSGWGVCPDCVDEANRRNEAYMKANPPPIVDLTREDLLTMPSASALPMLPEEEAPPALAELQKGILDGDPGDRPGN